MSEMSGMSGIETDAADVDPISEADVYLAYGRHQQAEDILNEALEKEPERNEIKLKLLEVFFAAKNRESFEQKAQEFHDALGDESDPMWAKVVTMGGQLCPGSDLFGGDSAEALKEDLQEDVSAGDDDLLDFDFDIDSDSVDTSAADATTGDAETDEMFAELEAATSGDAATATIEETPAEEDNSLDFDMGSDTAAETATDDKAAKDNSLDFDVSSLDFDLDTGSEGDKTEAASDDDGGLDFDLGDVDDAVSEEASADDEISSDDLGDELGDDAFGEVDEIGTKLDLAKAYVDMGDGDGAKSILEEVMEEGDDAQKKQAEELLAQL
jgi:pilus assembly protein FimV